MTMINFKRTGGLMGRELAMDFDLNSMPASEAGPDEYEYVITVIAGNSIHTVHVSDTSMPQSLRPFIDDLTEIAKATT
jgi:hypothetical protein